MIQRCTNHPSHSESLNVVQICQRCTNLSRPHKFCKEIKNQSTLYKSFNVIQIIQRSASHSTYVVRIIQRNTYHSTQYKSFNAVQITQLSTNLSTQCKSFNIVQIFQRCTNHYWTLFKSFKSFFRLPYYLWFCHIAILKKFGNVYCKSSTWRCLVDILKMSYRDKTIPRQS